MGARRQLSQDEYRTLAEFRYLLRRFMEFSQQAARGSGLTPAQHQALLAIKGFPGDADPTMGELAERLCIRHHSAVELVDRLEQAGLLKRHGDPEDRRRVQVVLTRAAEQHLAELSAIHLEELHRLGPVLRQILDRVEAAPRPDSARRAAGRKRPA